MKNLIVSLLLIMLCACRKDYNDPMNGNFTLLNLVGKYYCYVVEKEQYNYGRGNSCSYLDTTFYDTVLVSLS